MSIDPVTISAMSAQGYLHMLSAALISNQDILGNALA